MNRREALSLAMRSGLFTWAVHSLAQLRAQSILAVGPSWIELNGHPAEWLRAQGGEVTLVQWPVDRGPGGVLPPSSPPLRQVGDLQLRFAQGMSAEFYNWIGTCMKHSPPAAATVEKVVFRDGKAFGSLETGAYVTRLAVPELDVAHEDVVELEATLRLANVVDIAPPQLAPPLPPASSWRRCGFRMRIAGLERLCRRITGISAMVFQRPRSTNVLNAEHRNTVVVRAPILPLLQLKVDAQYRQEFAREIRKRERTRGSLDLLSPNGRPWLRFNFHGIKPTAQSTSVPGSPLQFNLASVRVTPVSSGF